MKQFIMALAALSWTSSAHKLRLSDCYDGTPVFQMPSDDVTLAVLKNNKVSKIHESYQDKDFQWVKHSMMADKPKFVVFFSENCPTCQGMHQDWINLAERLKDSVNVMAVSRDYNLDALRKLHVSKYPTIRLYKGEGLENFVEYPQTEEGDELHEEKFI